MPRVPGQGDQGDQSLLGPQHLYLLTDPVILDKGKKKKTKIVGHLLYARLDAGLTHAICNMISLYFYMNTSK